MLLMVKRKGVSPTPTSSPPLYHVTKDAYFRVKLRKGWPGVGLEPGGLVAVGLHLLTIIHYERSTSRVCIHPTNFQTDGHARGLTIKGVQVIWTKKGVNIKTGSTVTTRQLLSSSHVAHS